MANYKIAYVMTPIEFGGAEKVSLTFLKNVNRNKFDIYPIILIRPWEKENHFIQELKKEGYSLYKIPVANKPRREGRDFLRVARVFRMLYAFFESHSFDLVHTNGYLADIVGTPISKVLKIPHVSTCHGFISNDIKMKIINRTDQFVLRFSDRVIAVSEEIENCLDRSGIRKSRISMIQNAIQVNDDKTHFMYNRRKGRRFLGIEDHEDVIGYVGRLSREKGLQYLIESGEIIKSRGISFKILIMGDGPLRKELENLVSHKGLEEEIIFTGFFNDVENWIPVIDIFVLPSLTEGTPMALLEAMASGIPVIASAVGGIPKVIDSGKNGILVSSAEPEQIAKAISSVSNNEIYRAGLSRMAKDTIRKKFNLRDWVRKTESVYLDVVSTNNLSLRN